MMKLYLLSVLFIIILSCRTLREKSKVDPPPAATAKESVESFDDFNKRFHSDSTFQLSRVAFPIGGQYVDGSKRYKWTAKNWQLMKQPVSAKTNTTEYKHSLTRTPAIVVEKFWIENSGFMIERRFELKNGKWYLTYFEDVNL